VSDGIPEVATEIFAYAKQKRFHEALSICDKLLIDRPSDILGHYMKHLVLEMMGKKALAKKSLDRAIEIEAHPALYFMRAHKAMAEGRFDDAAHDLERAESRDDDDGSYGALIAFLRTECSLERGDVEDAQAQCEKIPSDFSFPGFKSTTKESLLERIREMSE
jgi:tetratricopeptide (TPR) repeat protein